MRAIRPSIPSRVAAPVAEVTEADGAVGGEQPEDPAGERRARLGGPVAPVELREQGPTGVKPDAGAAPRLRGEPWLGQPQLDPQLGARAGGDRRLPGLREPRHLRAGADRRAARLDADEALLVVAQREPAGALGRVD